ncbi:MAG: hypothetical protein M2R45_04972 [Verrucomicrobia subdivision 3 bacterium]|nr:hypothetical protein [Limisphaerales bacterium]MCS1414081.1 hypothetical protein [Limisphaerales bacterium]
MEPSRILPDLQCSLLCEDVRQESSGNFIIIGVIGLIRVPKIPIIALKLCVFNRWVAGIGSFTETVRLVGPDQTTIIRQSQVKFALREASSHATNVSLFGQVEFKKTGTYFIEVIVDEVMKLRFPLVVQVAPQKADPRQNPPPSSSGPPPQTPPSDNP